MTDPSFSSSSASSSAPSPSSASASSAPSENVALGDRMKKYESTLSELVIPSDGKPLIARIDGHSFSTFTRGFEKPFDLRLSQAMVRTAADLLEKFQACTAYTQSDEITLVFMPAKDAETSEWREWPFRGRVIKLCTLLASYAGVRFNFHLLETMKKYADCCAQPLSAATKEKALAQEAHFDARLFTVPNEQEAYNNVYWRMSYDCARNSIHGLAMCHFSTKELHGKNRNEMKEMLLRQKGIDYEAMPAAFKYGTFAKKQLYTLQSIDHATGLPVSATRSRVETFARAKVDVELIVGRYLGSAQAEKVVEAEGEGKGGEKVK